MLDFMLFQINAALQMPEHNIGGEIQNQINLELLFNLKTVKFKT